MGFFSSFLAFENPTLLCSQCSKHEGGCDLTNLCPNTFLSQSLRCEMPESCKSPFPLSCASSWLSLGFLPPPCSKQPSFAFCSCCSTPTPFSRGMTHPVSGGACRVLGKAQTRLCPLWALRSWQSSQGKGVMLSRLHEWRRRRTPRHQRAAVQCLGHRRAQGPG